MSNVTTSRAIAQLQEGLKPLLEETRAAWTPSSILHLPLQLFTDISPSALNHFQSKLQELARSTAPFELTLKGVGVTPSWRKPRTVRHHLRCFITLLLFKLWVGTDKGRDVLRRLSHSIVKAASEASVLRRQVVGEEQRITIATWSDVRLPFSRLSI